MAWEELFCLPMRLLVNALNCIIFLPPLIKGRVMVDEGLSLEGTMGCAIRVTGGAGKSILIRQRAYRLSGDRL